MEIHPKINQVAVTGRLIGSPEFKLTGTGARLTFCLAVPYTVLDRNDRQERTETSYLHVCVWGRPAQKFAEILEKGTIVYVTGRLRTWNYPEEDRNDRAHSRVEILAKGVQVIP